MKIGGTAILRRKIPWSCCLRSSHCWRWIRSGLNWSLCTLTFLLKETRCWNAHDQETQQESHATVDHQGSKSLSEQQGSKCTNQSCWKTTNHNRASCFIRSSMTSRPHRLKKTSSMRSKNRNLHHTWVHHETNLLWSRLREDYGTGKSEQ